MPDAGLLLQLAEIAGIFVGFGALISVRNADTSELPTMVTLRFVTWMGLWVLFAALVPAASGLLGLGGHAFWLSCSILGLVLFIVLFFTDALSREMRALRKPSPWSRTLVMLYGGIFWPVLVFGLLGPLLTIITGRWPAADPGLYFTALAAGLTLAGFNLLTLVFIHPRR